MDISFKTMFILYEKSKKKDDRKEGRKERKVGGRKTTHFKVKNIKLPLWHLEIHMLFWFGGFIKMMDIKKKGLCQCCFGLSDRQKGAFLRK